MSKVLVTGASGFVGRFLVDFLVKSGHSLTVVSRHGVQTFVDLVKHIHIDDLRNRNAWDRIDFSDFDVVIHLAARAHVLRRSGRVDIEEFRAVNVIPSISLFQACQRANVQRFVLISSIGVNGTTSTGRPFTESDTPNPTEPYSVSKWETEQALTRLSNVASTQLTIIRPALVYGPNAKGNFRRLMNLIERGWPIPAPLPDNRRNFLGVENLCGLIELCMHHRSAIAQTFVAADMRSVSTRELISLIAHSMERKARVINMSRALLLAVGSVIGRRTEAVRLSESLEIDSSKARNLLNWENNQDFPAGIEKMVSAFLKAQHVEH